MANDTEAPASGDIDFSGMDSAIDGDSFGELGAGNEGAEPAAAPEPQKETQADVPTPASAAPGAEAPAKPAETIKAPEAAQDPKAAPAASAPKPDDPAAKPAETAASDANQSELDKFLSDITQNEAQFVEHLATTNFKLSPEMVQALADGQGETMIPKIVAGGALWAVKSMSNIVQKVMPQIVAKEVARITQQQEQTKKSEEAFFSKWPQLDRSKHFADIQTISNALYASNPKMSFDELVSLTGAAVMAKHGIALQPAVQTPAKPNGFVPAQGARVVSQQPVDQNPFGGMALDYDEG